MPNRQQRRAAAAKARHANPAREIKAAAKPAAGPANRLIAATAPVSIQAAAGDGAAGKRFEIVAYTGEPMCIGWWDYPVVIDMASMDCSNQRIPALYDHRDGVDYIVGQSDSVACDGRTVKVAGPANGVGEYADKVRRQADAGYVWQASVGAMPSRVEFVDRGKTITCNGRDYAGPVYVGFGCVLREVSFVVLGGDGKTTAVVARRSDRPVKPIRGNAMDFETWLLSMGFADKTKLDDVQLANMQLLYDEQYPGGAAEAETETETNPAVPTTARVKPLPVKAAAKPAANPEAEERTRRVAELTRIDSVTKIAASYGDHEVEINGKKQKVSLHAIEAGWDNDKTKLEAILADRAQGPHIVARSHAADVSLDVLTGIVALRCGLAIDDARFAKNRRLPEWMRASNNDAAKNKIMEAADRRSAMSFVDICHECLRVSGKDFSGDREDMIRAAVSSGAFSSIFTTNVNAQVVLGYQEAADTTQGWVRETDVRDFKRNESIRPKIGDGLSKRVRGADAEDTEFADAVEYFKLAHYARKFTVDYMDIVDDSFGVIQDTPAAFGRAANRLRPDLIYAIILANPTLNATARALFNGTDGNTDSGALGDTALKAAISAMMTKQETSTNVNITPRFLIAPTALQWTAKGLISSDRLVAAGTAGSVTITPDRNVLTDAGLQLRTDARLDNGVRDPDTGTFYAGSTSGWYLACEPGQAKTFVVAYLQGSGRMPKVRSWAYDRDGKFGMGWDVSHSIGAAAEDWIGLQRRTG